MIETLEGYLRAGRQEVDAALDRWLPRPPDVPIVVSDAMRYSVSAGGKRLRPVLCLAAAEAMSMTGGRNDEFARAEARRLAMPSGCAIELIHTYSLIHDDLPAMDNDTMRRGRPTLHVVYGEGMAILAGDGLLAEAFALLSREPQGEDPELVRRKLRAIGIIGAAAGATGMVGGQALDLESTSLLPDGSPHPPLDPATLKTMHAKKTGALIRASAVCGAVMAGGDHALVEAIDRYAADVGLAFQIVDDILDVEGASAELGKTAGKDAAAGKSTYPALFGLEESHRLAQACADRAEATLADAGLRAGHLAEISRWIVRRRS